MSKLSKFLCLVMTFVLSLNILLTVNALPEKDNYMFSINYLEKNDNYSIFNIVENNVQFNLIIDNINNTYIVNDNIYTEDIYMSAIQEQANAISQNIIKDSDLSLLSFLKDKPFTKNIDTYNISTNSYENTPTTRCISCGHNPTSPPTSGYGAYSGKIRTDYRFILSVSAGTISFIASKIPTVTPTATIIKEITALVGIVLAASPNLEGSNAILNYEKEIALHSKCPKAAKERRTYEIYGKKQQHSFEFYSSNPF